MLRKILHYDLAISLDETTFSDLDQSNFIRRLARVCANNQEPVLLIENHTLSEQDYEQLLSIFFNAVQRLWRRKILDNQAAFYHILLSEAQKGNTQLAQILKFLETHFHLVQSEFRQITQILEEQEKRDEQAELERLKKEYKQELQELERLQVRIFEQQQELATLRKKLEEQGIETKIGNNFSAQAYNLPREVEYFVERNQYLFQVLEALDFKQRVWGAGIDGTAGVGKTTLAVEVAHVCRKNGLFERIIWTTAQTDRLETTAYAGRSFVEFDGLLDEIVRAFKYFDDVLDYPIREKQNVVERLIESSGACLLIIDNLETIGNYNPIAKFLKTTLPLKVITTTRKRHLGHGEQRVYLPPMEIEEVKQLVYKQATSRRFHITESEIEDLYGALGGIPLAILWSLGQYRFPSLSIDDYGRRLKNRVLTGTIEEQERRLLEYCFREAFESLTFEARQILQLVALFPEPVLTTAVQELLDLNQVAFRNASEELEDFSLIQEDISRGDRQGQPQIHLLPLTRIFALSELQKDEQGRQFISEMRHRYAEHLSSSFLTGIYIHAFTPSNKPIRLLRGATVLDFAYHVHTEIGHRFKEARINSQVVEIDHVLNEGDVVEVITASIYQSNEQWLKYAHTERAEQSIRTWLKRPQKAIKSIRRGNTFSLQCESTFAEREYIRAIALDPNNPWAYNKLGNQARIAGDIARARQFHRKALSLYRNNPYAFEGLACIHYQEGELYKASRLYHQALEYKPDYANALFGLGRCYCANRQYQNAANVFSRALTSPIPQRDIVKCCGSPIERWRPTVG